MERRRMLKGIVGVPLLLAAGQIGRAGQQKLAIVPRRKVVPQELIDHYSLKEHEGYGLFVLGMDGKPYDLDDVLFAMFDVTAEHWKRWAK